MASGSSRGRKLRGYATTWATTFAAISAAASVAGVLAGCAAPLVVGGAMVAGGAIALSDRRPVGIQIEDEAIEHRVDDALYTRFRIEPVNFYVTSYDRKVLLTGQVFDEKARAEAGDIASKVMNVREVVNELKIAGVSSTGNRADDAIIAGKLRAKLIDSKEPPFGVVKTRVTGGVVYLMGKVTQAEGDAAGKAASEVDGVLGVVKVFDYITAQQAADLTHAVPPTEDKSGGRKQP